MAKAPIEEKQELGPPIDIIDTVVLGIGRFRFWIIPFAAIGLCVGLAMALIKPNQYASGGKLKIEFGQRESLTVEQLITGSRRPVPSNGKGGFGMNDELTLLRTPEFYERVAREVGPDRLTERIDPTRFDTSATPKYLRWQHKLQDWWFNGPKSNDPEKRTTLNLDSQAGLDAARAMITRGLRLKASGSNILSIGFNARSPELAQDVVAAAMKVAIEYHREKFTEIFHTEFVVARIDEAESRGAVAKDEYTKHKKDCGFYDIKAQRETELNNRNRIELALDEGERMLGEISSEKEHYAKLLETTEPTIMQPFAAKMGPNEIWVQINQDIRKTSLKLDGLKLMFKEGSDSYIRTKESLEAKLAHLQTELEGVDRNVEVVASHEAEVPNQRYLEIQEKLGNLDLRKTQILDNEVRYNERLKEIDAKLDAIAACEPDHQTMQQQINSAAQEIGIFQQTMRQQEALAILDVDEALGNIQPIADAQYKPNKVGPKRGQELLMGLGGGIGAALAFGILRQLLDRKLRYPMSVQKMLGVRVLGVIPEQRSWRRLGTKLRRQAAGA